jgi:hypothetical protein
MKSQKLEGTPVMVGSTHMTGDELGSAFVTSSSAQSRVKISPSEHCTGTDRNGTLFSRSFVFASNSARLSQVFE